VDYAPTYYAAFLIDPDGNNVEAVCMALDHCGATRDRVHRAQKPPKKAAPPLYAAARLY
jgi:hypothetical protein